MTGGGGVSNSDQLLALGEERCDGEKNWDNANETKLKCLVRDFKGTNRCLIIRAKNTDYWMSVCSTTVSGTVLSAPEFRDLLCARYNFSPLNLQSHCDRCGTAFRVNRALICSTGVLVITRHKKISDKLLYLAQRAFTPESVRAKPLIHMCCNRSEKEICQGSYKDK